MKMYHYVNLGLILASVAIFSIALSEPTWARVALAYGIAGFALFVVFRTADDERSRRVLELRVDDAMKMASDAVAATTLVQGEVRDLANTVSALKQRGLGGITSR